MSGERGRNILPVKISCRTIHTATALLLVNLILMWILLVDNSWCLSASDSTRLTINSIGTGKWVRPMIAVHSYLILSVMKVDMCVFVWWVVVDVCLCACRWMISIRFTLPMTFITGRAFLVKCRLKELANVSMMATADHRAEKTAHVRLCRPIITRKVSWLVSEFSW